MGSNPHSKKALYIYVYIHIYIYIYVSIYIYIHILHIYIYTYQHVTHIESQFWINIPYMECGFSRRLSALGRPALLPREQPPPALPRPCARLGPRGRAKGPSTLRRFSCEKTSQLFALCVFACVSTNTWCCFLSYLNHMRTWPWFKIRIPPQ